MRLVYHDPCQPQTFNHEMRTSDTIHALQLARSTYRNHDHTIHASRLQSTSIVHAVNILWIMQTHHTSSCCTITISGLVQHACLSDEIGRSRVIQSTHHKSCNRYEEAGINTLTHAIRSCTVRSRSMQPQVIMIGTS